MNRPQEVAAGTEVAKSIRKMREDIHELIYVTATDTINPRAKSRRTDMVQLSESYARLTELELAAEGKVTLDSIATDLPELIQQFVAAEEARQAESEARRLEIKALSEELIATGGMTEGIAKALALVEKV